VAKPLTFTPKPGLANAPAPETKQAAAPPAPVERPAADMHETSRIPLETAAPPAPGEQPGATKQETSHIPLEAAAPVVAAVADAQPTRPVLKKSETSRIPLNAAVAAAGEDKPRPGAPKTIRIKPATTPTGLRAAPPVGAAAPDMPRTVAEPLAAKSKTSRISLETALAPETKQAQAAGPATVKLKPPSEAPTVKVAKPPTAQATEETKAAMSKTSRLDDLPAEDEESEDESPTRKKTIRVKRPDQQSGLKAPAVARVGGPVPPGTAAPQKTGTVGWIVFSVLAVAAVFVACVLVYVLAVQAVPSLGLSWPGKIAAL